MTELGRKIANKKSNAALEGIGYYLTEFQVKLLLTKAKISVSDWNNRGFHLARNNDKGDYIWGNCRFIPAKDNFGERKISDKMRDASRRNIQACLNTRSKEERSRIGRLGGLASIALSNPYPKTTEAELKRRFELVKHLEPNKWGFQTRASKILGCSPMHVGRLLKKWAVLGLLEL